MALFVILPAIASGTVGFFTGPAILDPDRTTGLGNAALRGLATTFLAFLLYAPLLAIGLLIADPERFLSVGGLMIGVVFIGLPATGPLVVPVGLLAGCLLYLARNRLRGDQRRIADVGTDPD